MHAPSRGSRTRRRARRARASPLRSKALRVAVRGLRRWRGRPQRLRFGAIPEPRCGACLGAAMRIKARLDPH